MREKSERQSVRQALCLSDLFEATPVLGATVFQGGLDTCPSRRYNATNCIAVEVSMTTTTWTKGVRVGLAGGLAATAVVDAIMMSVLHRTGQPAKNGFVLIGDTAAGFFDSVGIDAAGGVPVGLFFHFLIGIALGGLFGGIVSRVLTLQTTSKRKMVGLGVIYTELISIPILVLPPIILKMNKPDAVGWFRFTIPLHAVFGLVLGLVTSHGLRAPGRARPPATRPSDSGEPRLG